MREPRDDADWIDAEWLECREKEEADGFALTDAALERRAPSGQEPPLIGWEILPKAAS